MDNLDGIVIGLSSGMVNFLAVNLSLTRNNMWEAQTATPSVTFAVETDL